MSKKNNSAHAAHFMVHSLLLLHKYDVKKILTRSLDEEEFHSKEVHSH